MKRIIFILAFLLIIYPKFAVASMSDYCAVPPFISQTVTPNVLFIVDNSGSMKYPAYWPHNLKHSKTDTSFDPNKSYYGIFDPNAKYSYDSDGNYFYKDDNGDWSGNFLNWLTMRRYDILLKVLIGGNYKEENGNKFLQGFNVCESSYGIYEFKKKYDQSGYFPSEYIGYTFYIGKDKDGHSKHSRNDRYWFKVNDDWYAIMVKIDKKPTGLIQSFSSKLRLGLMVFNHGDKYEDGDNRGDGGHIVSYIADNNTSLADMFLNQDVYEGQYKPLYPHAWTPLAETFYEAARYFEAADSAYNDGVDYSQHDPIGNTWCRKNFVILITDGEATKDENLPGTKFNPGCDNQPPVQDSNFDIKDWMDKIADNEGYSSQWKKSYSSGGTYYLEGAAYYAHVTDLRSDLQGKQNLTLYTIYTFGKSTKAIDLLQKSAKYGGFRDLNGNDKPDEASEWDKNGDGIPDNYFEAQNGDELRNAISKAFSDILKQSSSGTSVSMLTQRTNKGSIALQAVFYPQKNFNGTKLSWVGYLYSWWLYNTRTAQNLREDTNGNKTLDVLDDYILNWDIDPAFVIKAYNSTAKGQKGALEHTYKSFDETHPIWEAGEKLADRSYDNRTIYTAVIDNNIGNDNGLVPFDIGHKSQFQAYLGSQTSFPANMSVSDLINYVRGKDYNGTRNRGYDSNKTWKLGDIVYSTPNVVDYGNYSVVFVGANDGMLHAFRVGYVKSYLNNEHPISIQNSKSDNGTDKLGEELWAFIPKNALPYLRYLADPNYCHMYFVDLKPYVVGVDTNGNGIPNKKILIGGMRFGGAVGCNGTDCVNPPSDTCPDTLNGICTGLSSYFALDITNPANPKFLWEFTNPDLGFTYSGPAFVTYKGTHYVVFASGPINYKGNSNQPLRLFVLKLKSNLTLDEVYPINGSTTPQFPNFKNAFGGRLFTNGIDYDGDGSTDYFFLGVSYNAGSNWKGNVIAVHVDDFDPRQWGYTKILNNPAGPVIDSVKIARCFDRYFIYFGTGRWFYKTDSQGDIKGNNRERLYGVDVTACLNGTASTCRVNAAHNTGICDELSGSSGSVAAWHIDLNPANGTYFKERDIADPTTTDQNIVFFTTIEPTSDICGFGGQSRIWGLNCATGGNFTSGCPGGSYKTSSPRGELLLQLSQGNIVEVKPSNFSGNETSQWYGGIAPETPTPFISPGGIKGELLLWLER